MTDELIKDAARIMADCSTIEKAEEFIMSSSIKECVDLYGDDVVQAALESQLARSR